VTFSQVIDIHLDKIAICDVTLFIEI